MLMLLLDMKSASKWRKCDSGDKLCQKQLVFPGGILGKKSESTIVEEVVERVRTELDFKSKRSDDLKGLVGIPERLEKIKSFLDSPTVRIVGIWGMGGIEKTTLAKLVFKRIT